jgi:penicillin amidase
MSGPPKIWLDDSGIRHVAAEDREGLWRGMGYCHGADRGLQMSVLRLLGQGRASEWLASTDEMLAVDLFFRRMNWGGGGDSEPTGSIRGLCDAYCDGVNEALLKKPPWELKLLGYRPEPWTPRDIVLLSRMVGYVALAQSQADMERLLVELVQGGVSRDRLEELFPGLLQDLDEDLLRKVTLSERVVPPPVLWETGCARMMASNNWVISGRKTTSGKPILANDPHLEVNRLPCIWYEIVLEQPGDYAVGATMAGLPAILIGRTPRLSWGVTYAFMDTVDSWIEDCRRGKWRRDGDDWRPFRARTEIIRRKGKSPVERTFYENDHGILDGDPYDDGYHLATRWSGASSGSTTIAAFIGLLEARDVMEGRDLVGRVETGWNWVLADDAGNIGYQMSGRMPRRRKGASGFVPLPGWEPANDWSGFVDPADLPRCINPAEGFFVTANQDLNAWGRARPINLPMGPYRAQRIRELLSRDDPLGVEDVCRMQYDLVSPQAREFMALLRPLLPDTPQGRILRDWDFTYSADSEGAFLFEESYRALFREIFGTGALGKAVADHLFERTAILADFYHNFDRILLAERSSWLGDRTREEVHRTVLARALDVPVRRWGESRELTLGHLLFHGKVPRIFGFDRGPVVLSGGRATVHQGQIYRQGDRTTSFAPSIHFVTDFGADDARTNVCGGPSDRRFSGRYCSDLEAWQAGRFKTVKPGLEGLPAGRRPFK